MYGKLMDAKKKIVLLTLFSCAFFFTLFSAAYLMRDKVSIGGVKGGIVFGEKKAPLKVVLIEDFQCKNCRAFSKRILPRIQSEYVGKGKAHFVLVPVSFLKGSRSIANGALEVYRQSPRQFYPFLEKVLALDGKVEKKDLYRIAKSLRGIDLTEFISCVEFGCHDKELEANLLWAKGLMGAEFRTPMLFVNGEKGSTYSFEAIVYQVERFLEKR